MLKKIFFFIFAAFLNVAHTTTPDTLFYNGCAGDDEIEHLLDSTTATYETPPPTSCHQLFARWAGGCSPNILITPEGWLSQNTAAMYSCNVNFSGQHNLTGNSCVISDGHELVCTGNWNDQYYIPNSPKTIISTMTATITGGLLTKWIIMSQGPATAWGLANNYPTKVMATCKVNGTIVFQDSALIGHLLPKRDTFLINLNYPPGSVVTFEKFYYAPVLVPSANQFIADFGFEEIYGSCNPAACCETTAEWTWLSPPTSSCGVFPALIAWENTCNSTSGFDTVYVSIHDTTPPVVTCNGTTVTYVECNGGDPMVQAEAVPSPCTATDNCDGFLPWSTWTCVLHPGLCQDTVIRNQLWVDACGNLSVHAISTVIIVDTQAPTWTTPMWQLPVDEVVSCDAIPLPATLIAHDVCDGYVTVTFTETHTNGCPYDIVRKWMATDACGNSINHTQTLHVVDYVPPFWLATPPANVSVNCNAVPPVASMPAGDNCDTDVHVTFMESVPNGSCPYTITRTWTATDNCGNAISHVQNITVTDTQAPTATYVPPAVTLQCGEPLPSATPTFTDNCDNNLAVTYSETVTTTGLQCPTVKLVIRVWKATDDCGNAVTVTQKITFVDTAPPAFNGILPTDVSVSCGNVPPATTLTATDACQGSVTVTMTTSPTTGTCPATFIRTWTATDNCNNTATHTQVVTVVDNTPPAITCPPNATVYCTALPVADYSVFGNATATDNCSDITTITEIISGPMLDGCGNGVILRTFTAVDACENHSSCDQTINVIGNGALQINWAPDTTLVGCYIEGFLNPLDYQPTVTSVCAGYEVGLASVQYFHFGGSNSPCMKVVVTWQVNNLCDTTSQFHQTIIATMDNEAPVFTGNLPTDTVLVTVNADCEGVIEIAVPTTQDCGSVITTLSGSFTTFGQHVVPIGVYQVTYTATDQCGNTATHTYWVQVKDDKAPTVYCQSIILTINPSGCDAWLYTWAIDAGSYDNCTEQENLHFSFSLNPSDTVIIFVCADLGVNVVTLYVWDESGNYSLCQVEVILQDNWGVCTMPPMSMPLITGEVSMAINSSSCEAVEVLFDTLSTTTDTTGIYKLMVANGDHVVKPISDDSNWLEGVTTYDLVKIRLNVLKIDTFTQAWQYVAADINHSGSVTTYDMVLLQQLILHIIEEVPGNNSWRYYPTTQVFTSPSAASTEALDSVSVTVNNDTTVVNWMAVKVGDVNGSYEGFHETELEDRFENQDPPTSVQQGNEANPYPNPASMFVTFPDSPESIEVFDSTGKKLNAVYGNGQWDVRGVVPGLYYVRVENKTFSITVVDTIRP